MLRPILITPGSVPSLAIAYARPRFIRSSWATSGTVKKQVLSSIGNVVSGCTVYTASISGRYRGVVPSMFRFLRLTGADLQMLGKQVGTRGEGVKVSLQAGAQLDVGLDHLEARVSRGVHVYPASRVRPKPALL
jgi:hypothetical protein